MFYKQVKDQNINISFVYDQYVDLGDNKYGASQLRAVISGLTDDYREKERVGYKDFFIDRDDWASRNNINSSESDNELKNAERFYSNSKNLLDLKQNKTISYLLEQVDSFLGKL